MKDLYESDLAGSSRGEMQSRGMGKWERKTKRKKPNKSINLGEVAECDFGPIPWDNLRVVPVRGQESWGIDNSAWPVLGGHKSPGTSCSGWLQAECIFCWAILQQRESVKAQGWTKAGEIWREGWGRCGGGHVGVGGIGQEKGGEEG